ncbi:type VI secretion system-associated protein TagO [Aliagarivorans taiwanensis]|uniref:type VI secretion system-associated protein TagO n=1 Tax=Aliagarivorans taiwanensis TaxID=561966 RepID=UPI0003FF0A4C|nr:type VI secretion system-associated protein TagO [Aliagarivorans taiwanensis]
MKTLTHIVVASGLALSGNLYAEPLAEQLLQCSQVTSHIARLECYDNLASNLTTTAAAGAGARPGQGRDTVAASAVVTEPVDNASDKQDASDIVASVLGLSDAEPSGEIIQQQGAWTVQQQARDGQAPSLLFSAPLNQARSSASPATKLQLRCEDDQASLSINWRVHLGTDIYVTSGSADSRGKRENWRVAADERTTIYPKFNQGKLAALLAMDQYKAQTRARADGVLVAIFDIDGLSDLLDQFPGRCGLG